MKLTEDQKEKISDLILTLDERGCPFPDSECDIHIACAICISENIIRLVEGENERN